MIPATVTMPGRLGDLLLSMPVAREIAKLHGGVVRVATSRYCEPAAPLIERLDFVRQVVIDCDYKIEHHHFGTQPWLMPGYRDDETYRTYHLGFRHFPLAGQLVTHLAGEPYGVVPAPGPWLPAIKRSERGPVAAHATDGNVDTMVSMIRNYVFSPRRVRVIGMAREVAPALEALREFAFCEARVVADFAEIHAALDGCSEFVGINSGPSIVAMGGGLPVVWPHRPGVEQERWAHEGCDVKTVDRDGTTRVLRAAC